jgi:hypothetical protein
MVRERNRFIILRFILFSACTFPLTPALSLGEREKLIQRWNNAERVRFAERFQNLFLLPEGEG